MSLEFLLFISYNLTISCIFIEKGVIIIMKNKTLKSVLFCLSFLLANFRTCNGLELGIPNDNNSVNLSDANIDSQVKDKTIRIKLTCAGSRCTSPRKVMRDNEGKLVISSDYLSTAGLNDCRFYDSANYEPVLNSSSGKEFWKCEKKLEKTMSNALGLNKNDLFFEVKKYRNGDTKLKLIRPGVGSERIYEPNLEDTSNASTNSSLSKLSFIKDYLPSEFKILPPGTLNTGSFSVEKSEDVLTKTILFFIDKFAKTGHDINFELIGHSRGAVTMGQVLDNVLSQLNSEAYKKQLCNAKINLNCILLDPVAGPDTTARELNLKSLNPSVNFKLTQIISTNTGAPNSMLQWAFSSSAHVPTDIKDSTIIFLPLGHDVGNKNMTLGEDGRLHKTMWKFNGKLLKFGQIGSLPSGIYFPNSSFYMEGERIDEQMKKNGICLTRDWRVMNSCEENNLVVKPIELVKLDKLNRKTLSALQQNLLMDEQWVKGCNRKDIFLKLINSSLHLNGVLPENRQLEFNSKFKLRVSKI